MSPIYRIIVFGWLIHKIKTQVGGYKEEKGWNAASSLAQ
jgi:hypothetical protein